MQAVSIERDDLLELSRWFAREPNLRPPASVAGKRLRQVFCRLELHFYLDTLSVEEMDAIISIGLPIGSGTLLPIGEEHMLLRRIDALDALRDSEKRLPDLASERVHDDLRAWIAAMRVLRLERPDAISVRIIERRIPDFPWSDGFSLRFWRAWNKHGCRIPAISNRPGAPLHVDQGRA
jgi:hypothetical protein